jgi:hypothetical protein
MAWQWQWHSDTFSSWLRSTRCGSVVFPNSFSFTDTSALSFILFFFYFICFSPVWRECVRRENIDFGSVTAICFPLNESCQVVLMPVRQLVAPEYATRHVVTVADPAVPMQDKTDLALEPRSSLGYRAYASVCRYRESYALLLAFCVCSVRNTASYVVVCG